MDRICTGCILIVIFLISGCRFFASSPEEPAASPTVQGNNEAMSNHGSCSLALEPGISDEEAIQQVLNAEGTFVVDQNIDDLMILWAEDSQIADAKNTSTTTEDDQLWQGKDAIYHRYVRIVFPGAPAAAQPSDLDIQITGTSALVRATTNIGDEVSPQGDKWELEKYDGCWQIQSLTYNLESAQ